MENRGALRFLVGTLSRQPHQRRQSAQPRYTSCAQPRRQRISSGGLHPTKKPNLPRGPVPPIAQQARRSESHHRHGSSLGPIGLSHAEVWSALRRQRCGILRTTKPPATNRVPQKEGGPTRPTARTSLSMRKKFLESRTSAFQSVTSRCVPNLNVRCRFRKWCVLCLARRCRNEEPSPAFRLMGPSESPVSISRQLSPATTGALALYPWCSYRWI